MQEAKIHANQSHSGAAQIELKKTGKGLHDNEDICLAEWNTVSRCQSFILALGQVLSRTKNRLHDDSSQAHLFL